MRRTRRAPFHGSRRELLPFFFFSLSPRRDARKPAVALSAVGECKPTGPKLKRSEDNVAPAPRARNAKLTRRQGPFFFHSDGFVAISRRVAGQVEPQEPQRAGVQSRRRRAHLGQTGENDRPGPARPLARHQSDKLERLPARLQKPNTACEYVAAHLSKIHGLDWHPEHEFILATSSQDNSVRVGRRRLAPPAPPGHPILIHDMFCACSFGTTGSPGST